MPLGLIELVDTDIICSVAGGGAESRFALADALPRLGQWLRRYETASARDREGDLAAIGQEMFGWLDEAGWASGWIAGSGDRELEVRVDGAGGASEAALLDAPWELLAGREGPLVLDPLRLFVVARRVSRPEPPPEPQHSDLRLMFMASAPAGQVELDYEAEEAAILEATKDDERVHLIVEETGVLRFLRGRLATAEGSCEALHLSCHGDIDKAVGPVLLLETPEGDAARATAGDLITALGAVRPQLVALSACRTAEMGRVGDAAGGTGRRDAASGSEERAQRDGGVVAGAGTEFTASFARQLVTQVANVLEWDGSVYDRDATEFAAALYGELGRGSSVPRATAVGRRALLRLRATDPHRGRHWHLARVYLGPVGGGPLCMAGRPGRRGIGEAVQKAFLDKPERVPVATREAFVGRRRAIQGVLRAFRDKKAVLVHGMGALGKSSLAARVASRVAAEPVVIFERYDALSVLDAVLEALDPLPRREQRNLWREPVKADPGCLAEALESLLEGPFDQEPILLIVDDLERILDTPAPGGALTGVAAAYRVALGAILQAFAKARTGSRLLLTNRYDFRLPDGKGGDLAAGLVRVPLVPMAERERTKQLRAAERIAGHDGAALGKEAQRLLNEALAAAGGNPGLQAVLTGPVLAGELEAAADALQQIAEYRRTGAPPAAIKALIDAGTAKDSENALVAFFARLSFTTYRAALTGDEARQLSAATLFAEGVPIPLMALEAAGMALGVEGTAAAVRRLLGLGLFDDWGGIAGHPHAAANPLARPLAPALDPADRPRLARAAFPCLAAAWRGAALRIRREEELPVFDRLGEVRERAVTMGKIADILVTRGELDEALRICREEELPVYDRLGEVRERAVTLQRIASALVQADGLQQGRIQEIYDALAEAYAIARRLGLLDGIARIGPTLAQILALGGHQDEALTVLDEAEAAFEKLGDPDGVSQVHELRAAIRRRQQ